MTDEAPRTLTVNRALVLTLWAAVVAERLGFDRAEALTLGRAVAGASAAMRGRALGIFEPVDPREVEAERAKAAAAGEPINVRLLGRAVPAVRTEEGIRAIDKSKPGNPASVERYLRGKFGDGYVAARAAMERLAASREPRDLAAHGFKLYEAFRPSVPAGAEGWGKAGALDLRAIDELAGVRSDATSAGDGLGTPRRSCGGRCPRWRLSDSATSVARRYVGHRRCRTLRPCRRPARR